MRFATGLFDGDPRLLRVDEGDRYVDVVEALPLLKGVHDVGALLKQGPSVLEAVRAIDGERHARRVLPRLAAPILCPSKIVCIGLNYRRHALEGGVAIPTAPIIFAKFPNSLVGPIDPIVHSALTTQLDYEAELGVVIGTRAKSVAAEDALDFVAGYVNANDVSARDLQHSLDGSQWVFGKTLDTFCPLGPYVVTPDEAGPWRDIRVRAWVNGELRQDEACGDMIFGVEELIAYISAGITLEPGDIILTGTPAGVGLGFSPPKWLVPGDVVEVELTGLGRQRSIVTRASMLDS